MKRTRARVLVTAGVFLASLGALGTHGHTANAQVNTCRSDPKAFLSDGTIVTMTASVDTGPGSVRLITYTLHLPSGLSVNKVLYTGGPFSGKEKLDIVSDGSPSGYRTDTVVTTTGHGNSVEARTQVESPGTVNAIVSTAGGDAEDLQVFVPTSQVQPGSSGMTS